MSRNTVDIVTARAYISIMKIDEAAARLEALGNPTRLQIYRALVRAGEAGLPVGKLQSKLDVAPSTLSHHVKALLTVGLIAQERAGHHADLPCELRRDARTRRFSGGRMLRRCGLPAGSRQGPRRLIHLSYNSMILGE